VEVRSTDLQGSGVPAPPGPIPPSMPSSIPPGPSALTALLSRPSTPLPHRHCFTVAKVSQHVLVPLAVAWMRLCHFACIEFHSNAAFTAFSLSPPPPPTTHTHRPLLLYWTSLRTRTSRHQGVTVVVVVVARGAV